MIWLSSYNRNASAGVGFRKILALDSSVGLTKGNWQSDMPRMP